MIKSIIKSNKLKELLMIVLLIGVAIFFLIDSCNDAKKIQKLENEKFENYVIIQLPNGKIFEGKADSYKTENFGQTIIVQIGDETYKTDRKNVVIIQKMKNQVKLPSGEEGIK